MNEKFKIITTAGAGVVLGLLLTESNPAQSATITYDFSVDIKEGVLTGETYTGFFSYDDESEPVGFGYGSEELFLTEFEFKFNGIQYTLNDVVCSFCPYIKDKFVTTKPFWVGNVFPEWGSDSLSVRTPEPVGFTFGYSIFALGQSEFEYGNVSSGVGVFDGDVTYTLRESKELPEPGTFAAMSLFGLGILLTKKKIVS